MTKARRRKPWRNEQRQTSSTPEITFQQLKSRELGDLESCRLAWEKAADPLAISVAVSQCELPTWLADALLVMLDPFVGPKLSRDKWRGRTKAAIDAARATGIAAARMIPRTWEDAYKLGEAWAAEEFEDLPRVDLAAAKKSYYRVRRGLENHGMYFRAPGFTAKRRAAIERTVSRLETVVATLNESGERRPLKK